MIRDLQNKELKALRKIRDREKLSMRMLMTIISVLREFHLPWVDPRDVGGVCKWFVELDPKRQTQLIDDAMGVTVARRAGMVK